MATAERACYCGRRLPRCYPNKKYCSAKCRSKRPAEQIRRASRFRRCEECGQEKRSENRLCKKCSFKQSRSMKACPRCGNTFWPWAGGKHARKFCSVACIKGLPKPKPAKPAKASIQRICRWCIESFATTNCGQSYCSARCQKTANARRKKARRKSAVGSLPSLWEIYLRDQGICQLCKTRVPRSAVLPHPKAATLDHIVPLSKGGTHDAINIQLAHSRCNTSKGNRPHQDQLRMFG